MTIQEVKERAENGDLQAMVMLGDYYAQQGGEDEEAIKWYERAIDGNESTGKLTKEQLSYTAHMASLTQKIIAASGAAVRRKMDYGYMFSKEDYIKLIQFTNRELSLIQRGVCLPDINPNEIYEMRENARYEAAICCFELKQYDEAAELVNGNMIPGAQLLSALIAFVLANDNELGPTLMRLAYEFPNAANMNERWFEEEKIYAMTAVFLAGGYRLGVPGFTNPNMEKSVQILRETMGVLKNDEWKQYVFSEYSRYKPKMFGGYKYV